MGAQHSKVSSHYEGCVQKTLAFRKRGDTNHAGRKPVQRRQVAAAVIWHGRRNQNLTTTTRTMVAM